MTATRVTCGAIWLSSSSHLAAIAYSKLAKPVIFPPGRAKLATNPAPTGSATCANTMGTLRVSRCNTATEGVAPAKITSGFSFTSSAAYARARSGSPANQRYSICNSRPSVQPSLASPSRSAPVRAWPSGSRSARFISTPMRRLPSGCCARAATGHAAAPPSRQAENYGFTVLPQPLAQKIGSASV
jgi:hypothetical protein